MAQVRVMITDLMKEKTLRDNRDPKTNPVTQEEVAEAIGVPQGTISRWAGNKVDRLDKDIMARLCNYFECEIGDLLSIEQELA